MVYNVTGVPMSDTAFDGFYTPAPADVPRDSRWPWLVMATGAAIVLAGAVILSGGGTGHVDGVGAVQPQPASSAQR
jgi:hypothetical protein